MEDGDGGPDGVAPYCVSRFDRALDTRALFANSCRDSLISPLLSLTQATTHA